MQILEKNLKCLDKFNQDLSNRIRALSGLTKNYDINTNLAGEYNLLINSIPVHSITGCVDESQKLFENLPFDNSVSIHFLYGLGLGYVLDVFLENSKGHVVIYEPDLETLLFVFSTVDFSQNFANGKLHFVSCFDDIDVVLDLLFRYKSQVSVSYLDYYKFYQKDDLERFKAYLFKRVEMVNHNYSFQVRTNFQFFKQTISNLAKKFEHPIVADYKNVFKNVPAIIVSAGPSLHKNIEILKKYKDNALIFCGGTSLKTCCNNGVIPDFLNVIERRNTLVHYDLPDTDKMNLVVEPFTESSYFKKKFKNILYTTSLETDDARWYLELGGKPLVPFETKGTVAYHSIYTAYYLGCNPIILVGQDLAYSDGECYAKGSNFDGLSCVYDNEINSYKVIFTDEKKFRDTYFSAYPDATEERKNAIISYRLKELNNNMRTVLGQNGEKMPTDAVYALFLEYIQDFAKQHKDERILLNSSLGGALINGFDTISLETAIHKYAHDKLDKAHLLECAKFNCSYDKNVVLSNIKKNKSLIVDLVAKLEKGCALALRLEELLRHSCEYTPEISSVIKKLSTLFIDITSNLMLKNRLVRIVVFSEYMELDYLTRLYDEEISLDVVKDFSIAYCNYFTKGLEKAEFVLEELNVCVNQLG